jgi:hypothetical protein
MSDRFQYRDDLMASARSAAVIVPNDTSLLPSTTKAIFCGGSGIVVVDMADGQVDVPHTVAPGTVLPLRAIRVKTASTVAAGLLVAWW